MTNTESPTASPPRPADPSHSYASAADYPRHGPDEPPFSLRIPLWVMLVSTAYREDLTPAAYWYQSRADIMHWEVVGDGYEAGGQPLTNTRWSRNGAIWLLMADDACWDPVTVRAGGMITYRRRSLQTGRPGDDRLIAYSDFNGVAQPIVGTLRVELAGRPLLTSGGNA